MIGLDTNVLVRYIMQDDKTQSAKAAAVIESLSSEEPGYIGLISVVELAWVLSGSYGLSRQQLALALETILRTKEVVVERADQVLQALRVFKATSADFADCLIERSAATAGCSRIMTFDVKASKLAGMTLIQ